MEIIDYPYVKGSIEPLSKPNRHGVFSAQTSVGKMKLQQTDKGTIFAYEYWYCSCGKTYKKSKVPECPDCHSLYEESADALIEDVVNLLNPI